MYSTKFSLQHGLLTSTHNGTGFVELVEYDNNEDEFKDSAGLSILEGLNITLLDKTIIETWLKYKMQQNTLCTLPYSPKQVGSNVFGKEPIAIIGMGCRLPGANTLDEFWKILEAGLDVLSTPDAYPRPGIQWGKDQPRVGFLSCPVDEFDYKFFGINPKDVEHLDPQTRLLHEVVWESLESSGINPLSLHGTRTGIFSGSWTHDYKDIVDNAEGYDHFRKYLGNSIGACSARLSFLLGTTGPCVSTESACSSAIVAVDMAVKSLRNAECNLAIASGVNLILKKFDQDFLGFAISPSGCCRTFDESADGFARAEGCCVLVLKRMSDAVRDGDHIWALLRGTAIVQEGISDSLGSPTVECESTAMRLALEDAHVAPSQVSFVEAHGTGTRVGDPLEMKAITKAYGSTDRRNPLIIGSVKTNVGHTESCSGITGIIKTVLAMHHEKIPRHLNLQKINPEIDLEAIPATIPLECVPWPRNEGGTPRLAGVSSFGITGTDGHVILQDAPNFEERSSSFAMERPLHLLKISGKTQNAVEMLHTKYIEFFRKQDLSNPLPDEQKIANVTYTANTGRGDFNFRQIIIGSGIVDMTRKMEGWQYIRDECGMFRKKRLCFLFPGQCSQYRGMAKELYDTSPVFRIHFDACEKIVRKEYGFSVGSACWGRDKDDVDHCALKRTLNSQTSIFCVEFCLLKLWESWGIIPNYVVGHSLGEYAAAVAAGILDLPDALKLVVERSQLIESLPPGNMLAVKANKKQVEDILRNNRIPLDIAAINSEDQTVVAGDIPDISTFQRYCQAKGMKNTILESSHAFHSHHMNAILDKFRKVTQAVRYEASPNRKVRFISGMEGKVISCDEVNAEYWVRHTRDAVQFTGACKALQDLEITEYLEVGLMVKSLSLRRVQMKKKRVGDSLGF